MKKIKDSLIPRLREFLTIFMPKQARRSPHTVIATQQVWNMLLSFICELTGKRVENLTFADLNRENIMNFLDEMQRIKGWSPSTRNHRLARIRSFFRYAASIEPTLVIYLENLRGIPAQKDVNKTFVLEYMTKDAITALLRQPDPSKKAGIRDLFFLVLMYDSAARDCEMLSMPLGNLDPVGKVVYLHGKGNKPRSVPICDDTIKHFHRYAGIYHPAKDASLPMFYTIRHGVKGTMSDDNVARFVGAYGKSATLECPEVPDNVHPHMVRKSRAMMLYQAGMPLELLAQFLGHDDPMTTLVYAHADNDMKRRAIEKVAAVTGSIQRDVEEAAWVNNDDMIKRLLGLN